VIDAPPEPLLPRIAAGDERAVGECVARYGSLVWSLARRWSPDRADAEDAVQEIFTDLWRTAARFEVSRSSESGWVAMIARRRLIDRTRRRERQPVLDVIPDGFDIVDEREVDLDRNDRVALARQVLTELAPAQRRMLELSLLHGRTHDEIARETNTPLGTVKSHIKRGLDRARALLAARLDGPSAGATAPADPEMI
jgi:RNA polymerase sigma-70 factor (ECF subfamily)